MRKRKQVIGVGLFMVAAAGAFLAAQSQRLRTEISPIHVFKASGTATAPSALPSAAQSKAISLVQSLTPALYEPGSEYERRAERLRSEMATWKKSEFLTLAAVCSDPTTSIGDKRLAVHLLGLAGRSGIAALAAVASTQVPATGPEEIRRAEFALRVQAMEALDLLAADYPEAARSFDLILQLQEDPQLHFFAEVARLGFSQKRSGKLHRLIEATIKQGKVNS